jgi:molybdate transport system substrate-binding protein
MMPSDVSAHPCRVGGTTLMRAAVLLGLALAACLDAAGPAAAAELSVLSANVFTGVLDDVVKGFEASSGNRVAITYATAGRIKDRVLSGEAGDVAILTKPQIDRLERDGRIARGTVRSFAKSQIAVVVRSGAARPDISSIDAFRRALLDAPSVSYPDPARGGATGVLFTAIISRLGVADALKPRTRFPAAGRFAVELVANGEVDWAIAQPMEALLQQGVDIVGPLPAALQDPPNFTFAAGQRLVTAQPEAARLLIGFLTSRPAAMQFSKAGMVPEPASQ